MSQMSQDPGNLPDPQAPANPAMVVRRRPASVTLRGQSGEPTGSTLLDPANQSLADALKITYRLLQLGMVALVAVFVLSGLQSVKEGERGIRVVFGKVESDDLPPGFQFSLPRPMGEIVKVPTGQQSIVLLTEFFPGLRREDMDKTDQDLAKMAKNTLDPIGDGSLLTGDLNIAHTRWEIRYQRQPAQIRQYAANVDPDTEQRIVRAAAMQAVVQAAAGLTIDELFKNLPDASRTGAFMTVEERAKSLAQRTLDRMRTGIEIESMKIIRKIPPMNLINDFEQVNTSVQTAQSVAEQAEQERQATLAGTAGDAAGLLLRLIGAYDTALSAGDRAAADAALERIDAVLDDKPVDLDGRPVSVRVTGRAAALLAEARQYRASVVSRAQAEAKLFEVKLASYRANPQVVLAGDWAEAFSAFLARDTVQVFWLPGGTRTLELFLNRDPDVQREQEQARAKRLAEEIARQQARELQDRQFQPTNEIKARIE